MRGFTVVGAVIAVLLAFGSSASATTRYVDDDRKQCPQATFTKIQPAIDASSRIDAVRVCAGTYPEQLALPAPAPGLYVSSLPAGAARIVVPPGGLVARPDPRGVEHLNLVQVLGDQQRFNDFNVGGVLGPRDPPDACLDTQAIEVDGAAAVVDRDAITYSNAQCLMNGFAVPLTPVGVLLAGRGAIVQRSTITGTGTGVSVQNNDRAVVQANTIVGPGLDLADVEQGVFAGGDSSFATHVSIRSNDISGSYIGVILAHASGLVKANVVHDNRTGIWIAEGTNVDVDSNVARHNVDDGIGVSLVSTHSVRATIRGNDAHDNGRFGIAVLGCVPDIGCAPPVTSSVLVDHNVTGANGAFDCVDARPSNDVWNANIGVTSSPTAAGLCSPR